MIVIGITGKAGSGKDTVADYLVAHHGFIKYSMAGPLKAMLAAIGEPCETQEDKAAMSPVFGVTRRRLAQTLGTEWMRNCVNPDGWVLLAEKFIDARRNEKVPGVVVSDIRFDNEAEMVVRTGGYILQMIGRGGIDGSHESEVPVYDQLVDFIVDNSWSTGDTLADVDRIIRETNI